MIGESLDVHIHIQKDKRVFRFAIPYGTPYEEVYAVLKDIEAHVQGMEKRGQEQAEKQEKEKEAKAETNG